MKSNNYKLTYNVYKFLRILKRYLQPFVNMYNTVWELVGVYMQAGLEIHGKLVRQLTRSNLWLTIHFHPHPWYYNWYAKNKMGQVEVETMQVQVLVHSKKQNPHNLNEG